MRELKYPKYLEEGMVFNRLTVIEVDEGSKIKNRKKVIPSRWKYKCSCECGGVSTLVKNHLVTGHTISCGCYASECTTARNTNGKMNFIEINGDVTKIYFYNSINYTIIDTEDYGKIKNYCWNRNKRGYVYTSINKNKIHTLFLHRIINNTPEDMRTDHINRNRLDNRKSNLRTCTLLENARNKGISKNNTSGITGVYYRKSRDMWFARIGINNGGIHLGYFKNKQDAIDARYRAEIKYFGEFAPIHHKGIHHHQ